MVVISLLKYSDFNVSVRSRFVINVCSFCNWLPLYTVVHVDFCVCGFYIQIICMLKLGKADES